jgi:hypothetical protein
VRAFALQSRRSKWHGAEQIFSQVVQSCRHTSSLGVAIATDIIEVFWPFKNFPLAPLQFFIADQGTPSLRYSRPVCQCGFS